MNNALIGYSGFVGTTLRRQTTFEHLYRSTNINDINGKVFDIVVCAAAPAQKWLANLNPIDDKKNITQLIQRLKTIKCKHFILISTVDVFEKAIDIREDTLPSKNALHAYGTNRLILEDFVRETFENHLIVRLPGLVGPSLKKNIIFDLLNNNDINKIDSEATFQFYPMTNLWFDISVALDNNLKLVHLTSEPTKVSDIAKYGFNLEFSNHVSETPAFYDMKTVHNELYNSNIEGYMYTSKEVFQAVRAYAQSEPKVDSSPSNTP